MNNLLIQNATLINEGRMYPASVWIQDDRIQAIFEGEVPESVLNQCSCLPADGKWLIPGVIDDHVHFREPGLEHKADLRTESSAAVAGGVTSFMEMPNTKPATTSIEAWEDKMQRASERAHANYAFYLGATNDNLDVLEKADFSRVCGVKVFMGSSTGNMLVDNERTLEGLFQRIPSVVAVHAESEAIIQANKAYYLANGPEVLDIHYHSLIRSAEACYASTARAVELAQRWNARLHVLHLSTEKELSLFDEGHLSGKRITAEACLLHLWFHDADYSVKGNAIKCNPSIKTLADRAALRQGVASGRVDVVATDHAPHLWAEKQGDCLTAASGAPFIQYSLPAMLDLVHRSVFTPEVLVERMCHAPARIYSVQKRGFLREGYYADLVLIDPKRTWTVQKQDILSKCGWSPLEGTTLTGSIETTWVNGRPAYQNGRIVDAVGGRALEFGS